MRVRRRKPGRHSCQALDGQQTVLCQSSPEVSGLALSQVRRPPQGVPEISMESLILAQDERWRRASHMQVERGSSGGNTGEGLVANG